MWVVCDVYENDIPKLQVGQEAKIVLNAYPDKPLSGRVSDIGPILDPSLRTAKVRIEVANPGFLKLGMFATATFTSRIKGIARQRFRPMPCFICTTVTGFSFRPVKTSSSVSKCALAT